MFGSLRLAIVGTAVALSAAPVAADSGQAASRQKQPGKVPTQGIGGPPVLLIVSGGNGGEELRLAELIRALVGPLGGGGRFGGGMNGGFGAPGGGSFRGGPFGGGFGGAEPDPPPE